MPVILKDVLSGAQGQPRKADDTSVNAFVALPWQLWQKSELCFNQGLTQSLCATVAVALREVHAKACTMELPVDIQATPDGKKYRVVAARDIKSGELVIPPCVSVNPMSRISENVAGTPQYLSLSSTAHLNMCDHQRIMVNPQPPHKRQLHPRAQRHRQQHRQASRKTPW